MRLLKSRLLSSLNSGVFKKKRGYKCSYVSIAHRRATVGTEGAPMAFSRRDSVAASGPNAIVAFLKLLEVWVGFGLLNCFLGIVGREAKYYSTEIHVVSI